LDGEHKKVHIDHNVRDLQKLRKREVLYSGHGSRVSFSWSLIYPLVTAIILSGRQAKSMAL
jgi:hypothetical protein